MRHKTLKKPIFLSAFLALGLMTSPLGAQEVNRLLDSRELIGHLVPVTGDVAVVNLNISFKIGSSDLTAEAEAQLDQLGMALESPDLEGLEVGLFGHTDASGSASYNMTLSDRRAKSVRDYLLSRFQLDESRLTARGYGEERLLDPARPNASVNRRVEIVTTRPVMEPEAPAVGETTVIN